MKKYSLLLAMVPGLALAQGNLVPNWSFDDFGKKGKIKGPGLIEVAVGWSSPSEDKADLYHKKSKDENLAVPDNLYGRETPEEGDAYAGILAYSYKEKANRTYIQTQLSEPLKEGKAYCVKFLLSLGDMAKYACSGMGAYLSEKGASQKEIYDYSIKPQIMHSKNRVFDEQYTWDKICQIYKANGKENFITIGNFSKQEEVSTTKMKRPRGFSGTQLTNGYYYIENVSIIPMDSLESCICEKKGQAMAVQYTRNLSMDHGQKEHVEIEHQRIHFNHKSPDLNNDALAELEVVLALLNQHAETNVQIEGHTELEEESTSKEDNISEKRAKTVMKWLVEKGINQDRMSISSLRDEKPVSSDGSESGRAQNRRVEFKVVQ